MLHINIQPYALLLLSTLVSSVFSRPWSTDSWFRLQHEYVGHDFYRGFDFATFDDPTHGRVNYVSQDIAIENNLTHASHQKFIMRADYKNTVSPESRGRDSVRIQSQATYTESITVLDLTHMPEGCSTWPAFWTISSKGPWPIGGEIDVIEVEHVVEILFFLDPHSHTGVNNNIQNVASLHTTAGCTMPSYGRLMSGESTSTDCDAFVNSNQGCGVSFDSPYSYGSKFNDAGGGWYVMRRTADDGVTIWFWSRRDPLVPYAVRDRTPVLRPDATWGIPVAYFPSTTCSADHFDAHQIIFDLTFCGDWAGAVYDTSGCPGDCVDFVNNNPSAFLKAYWEINSLRVYTRF